MSCKKHVNRLPNGQYLPGTSGNRNGRPKGIKNTSTELKEAFEVSAKQIAQTVINAAMDGDIQAAKIVIERLQPAIRSRAEHVEFELPENTSLSSKADAILLACSQGKLAPDVTALLITALGNQGRLIEMTEIENRIELLEGTGNENK